MQLNHREYKGFREGMTIQDVIEDNRFTWPKIVVRLNRKVIEPELYAEIVVSEEDDLEVIHLLAGG